MIYNFQQISGLKFLTAETLLEPTSLLHSLCLFLGFICSSKFRVLSGLHDFSQNSRPFWLSGGKQFQALDHRKLPTEIFHGLPHSFRTIAHALCLDSKPLISFPQQVKRY